MKKAELFTQENKGKFNITNALDLLKNKSFLSYFINFIKYTDDDILGTFCLEKGKILLFLKDINSKNDTEIFEFFSDFFKNDIIMSFFIITLEIEFKDDKEFHKIADTLDYIINLSKSIEKYEINLLVEKMKSNVSNIIMLETKNPYIKLMKLGFNNFPEDLDIKEVKENDNIRFFGENFIKIILTNNKEFYLGNNGKLLDVKETGIKISQIIYQVNIGGNLGKLIKIKDEFNKEYIIIENISPYISGNIEKEERIKTKILDACKKRIGNFDFLEVLSEKNETFLYDLTGNPIDLNYIVTKLLKGLFKGENIINLQYISEIKDILKIYEFGETKFVKIIVNEIYFSRNGSYKYKNTEMIISDQGKILIDENGNYIKDLHEIRTMADIDFVSFSISDFGIDGYIDKNGKILQEGGKNIFHISKTPFSDTNGNRFFKIQKLESKDKFINGNKLKNYDGFDEKSEILILDEKDDFKIDDKNVKSVGIKIRRKEPLFTIEFIDGKTKKLTYKELILQNKEIIPNPFMSKINKTIDQM